MQETRKASFQAAFRVSYFRFNFPQVDITPLGILHKATLHPLHSNGYREYFGRHAGRHGRHQMEENGSNKRGIEQPG